MKQRLFFQLGCSVEYPSGQIEQLPLARSVRLRAKPAAQTCCSLGPDLVRRDEALRLQGDDQPIVMNHPVAVGVVSSEPLNQVREVLPEFVDVEFTARLAYDEASLCRLVESPQPRRHLTDPPVHIAHTAEHFFETVEFSLQPRHSRRGSEDGIMIPAIVATSPVGADRVRRRQPGQHAHRAQRSWQVIPDRLVQIAHLARQ